MLPMVERHALVWCAVNTPVKIRQLNVRGRRFPFVGLHGAAALGILFVALLLRFVAAHFGLPADLHPDERVIVNGALDMVDRHSFEPPYYMRPDHLEMKINYLLYVLYAKGVLGMTVADGFRAHPGYFRLISRTVTIAFSGLLMMLCYLAGRRISRACGLAVLATIGFGAALFADSTYATPDIPLTALLAAAMLALVYYLGNRRLASLGAACFLVAAGVTVKYPAILGTTMIACAVVIAAVRQRRWWEILTRGAFSMIMTVCSIFVISPSLFTNVREVQAALVKENGDFRPGADGLSPLGNVWFYAATYLTWSGVLLTLATLVGLVVLVRRRRPELLLVGAGVAVVGALSVLSLHWPRWGVPLYASGLFCAGIGFGQLWSWAMAHRRLRVVVPLGVVTMLVAANAVALDSVAVMRGIEEDNRLVARGELAAVGITPENTVSEGYSAFKVGHPGSVFDDFRRSAKGNLVPVDSTTRYVVLSGCFNSRFFADPDRFANEVRFYGDIRQQYRVVRTYDPAPAPVTTPWEVVNISDYAHKFASLSNGAVFGCPMEVLKVIR